MTFTYYNTNENTHYIPCRDINLFYLRLVIKTTLKGVSELTNWIVHYINIVLTYHPSTNSSRKSTTHPPNI